jgi:hypothetical protein
MVGPALGGIIIVSSSFTATFVIEAIAFTLGAAFMLGVSHRPAEGEIASFGLRLIKEGWKFLRHRRLLQANFAIDLNAMVLGMPTALFPAVGTAILRGDASTVGLLYAAPGAGALAAAITSGWVGSIRRQGRAVIISVIIWGAGIAAFGLSVDAIPDIGLTSVKRFSGENDRFVVDESILSGHVHGEWAGMNGGGAPVSVRILHIFELRNGLICFENAWFDAANVQRQIISWKETQG